MGEGQRCDVDTGAVVRFPRRWLIGANLLNEPAVSGGVNRWSNGNRDDRMNYCRNFLDGTILGAGTSAKGGVSVTVVTSSEGSRIVRDR